MTKALALAEMSKGKSDNTNNATKKFDYTAIANRLRTVSWSNYGHPNSFSMNIEKGYSFLKSLKPIDFFDLYIHVYIETTSSLSRYFKKSRWKEDSKPICIKGAIISCPSMVCSARQLVLVALLVFISIPDVLRNPQARIQNIFSRGGGPKRWNLWPKNWISKKKGAKGEGEFYGKISHYFYVNSSLFLQLQHIVRALGTIRG